MTLPRDWTPVVVITAIVAVATVLIVWAGAPDGAGGDARAPNRPRRHAPAEVVVWVGDIEPNVRAVLSPVWGDPVADREHDGTLNERLRLPKDHELTFFRLMVFNMGTAPHRFTMEEDLVTVAGADPAEKRGMRSVPDIVERRSIDLSRDAAFSLSGLGVLTREIEIPPSQMANLVIAFDAGTSLGAASSVHTVKGQALRRRQMPREWLHALMEHPSEERVRDL